MEGPQRDDDETPFRPPPPPDDRLWRHPSELGAIASLPAGPSHRPARPVWGIALVAGLAGAILALTGAMTVGFGERVVERGGPDATTVSLATPVATLAAKAIPGIARVAITDGDHTHTATGIALRSDGYLMTSAHIVEGADAITVELSDGRTLDATVTGTDPDTDVAVLRVAATDVPVAPTGTALGVRAGDQAVLLSAPAEANASPSVTAGIVSSVGHSVKNDGRLLVGVMMADLALPEGGTGGALVDSSGAVVGLAVGDDDSFRETGLVAVTPVDLAAKVSGSLIVHGHVTWPWAGIEGRDAEPSTARAAGVAAGAEVRKVVAEGPAAAAGVQAGDVVCAVDEEVVGSMADLMVTLRSKAPGDVVVLTVASGGSSRSVSLTLDERPPPGG